MSMLSTYLLVILGLVFILQLATGGETGELTRTFVFDPSRALSEPWLFLTSIFLHGDLTHLFFNAYALFMFGTVLESRVSKKDFLIIYFGAGLIGSLFYYSTYLLDITDRSALGASGAIYGILGAVAILLPNLRIFMWFFPMKMSQAAMLWVAIEFLGTFNMGSGVASAAHLGGLFFGLAYAWSLKKKTHIEYTPIKEENEKW